MDMNAVVEVIKEGQITRVPRWQAEEEDLFILREPEKELVSESGFNKNFFDRKEPALRKDGMEKYRPRIELKKNNIVKFLVDNFHWKIVHARRERGLSRKKVAEAIGEKEEVLKELELGRLPRDDFVLITKIENCFGFSLRKDSEGFNAARKMVEERARQIAAEKKAAEERNKDVDMKSLLGKDVEVIE